VSEPCRSLAAASAEQLYVSVSRGRQACYLYTDDRQALLEAVERSRPKGLAHDLLDRRPPRQAGSPLKRRAFTLARLKSWAVHSASTSSTWPGDGSTAMADDDLIEPHLAAYAEPRDAGTARRQGAAGAHLRKLGGEELTIWYSWAT